MGSFTKIGKRKELIESRKKAKKHMKEFYKIMGELDEVAQAIYKEDPLVIVDEENIAEVAAKYTDRTIADMEKFLLLGKLNQLQNGTESQDNVK